MPSTPNPSSCERLPSPSLFLVEEITHRVLNEYTEAIGSLSLAAAAAPDRRSGRAIAAAAERLRAYAEAHRALQLPVGDGLWDLAEYVARLCARVAAARLSECGVRLIVTTEAVWLDANRCWRVGLIVAELMRNAGRHGLQGGSGEIRVVIGERGGRVSCCVSDNGRAPVSSVPGRGRRLTEALAAELGGTIRWSFTPAGCCARLELPLESALASAGQGQRLESRATKGRG